MAQTAKVQIDDAQVIAMLSNPNLRRAFPFLATAHTKRTKPAAGCSSCSRKKKNNVGDLAAVRKSLATMPVEQKAKLKQIMGTKQVVVKYDNGRGKRIVVQF